MDKGGNPLNEYYCVNLGMLQGGVPKLVELLRTLETPYDAGSAYEPFRVRLPSNEIDAEAIISLIEELYVKVSAREFSDFIISYNHKKLRLGQAFMSHFFPDRTHSYLFYEKNDDKAINHIQKYFWRQ